MDGGMLDLYPSPADLRKQQVADIQAKRQEKVLPLRMHCARCCSKAGCRTVMPLWLYTSLAPSPWSDITVVGKKTLGGAIFALHMPPTSCTEMCQHHSSELIDPDLLK